MTATLAPSPDGVPGASAVDEPGEPGRPERGNGARPSRKFWIVLGIVVLAGLVWRVVYITNIRETVDHPSFNDFYLNGDQIYYRDQALALAHDGLWFVDPGPYELHGYVLPSAGHVPAYTLYLAAGAVVGLDGQTDERLMSAVLGAITVGLIGFLGFRLVGARVGIIAAVLAAAYPNLWINNTMVMSETMTQFLVALWLLAAYAYWRSPTLRRGILFGVATGVACLSRSELALLFLIVVIPVCLLARRDEVPRRRRITHQVLPALLAGAVVIAPWSIFNTLRFGSPVFLATTQGTVLSAGACDETFYGEFIGFVGVKENCFKGPFIDEKKKDADEIERDAAPWKYAKKYYSDHLGRVPIVVAARIGRVWDVFRPRQETYLDWWLEGRGRGAVWTGLAFYYAMIPFAIAGLVAMRRRKLTIIPMIGLALTVTFAVASTFGILRYRAQFEVALVVIAAIGIDVLWRWIEARRNRTPASELPGDEPPDVPTDGAPVEAPA